MHKRLPADRWLALGAVAAVLLVATPGRSSAQDTADERGTLQGVILDEGSGEALGGALFRIEGRNRAVLANQDGRFRVQDLEFGRYYVTVTQLGYDTLRTEIDHGAGMDAVRLGLTVDPIVLERVTVMIDSFERERNSSGSAVRHFDHGVLAVSPAFDALDFVLTRTPLSLTGCPNRLAINPCAFVRGRPYEVRVYLDDALMAGGLQILSMFRPDELFLLDVHSGGRSIRAYTHWYVQTVAQGRRVPPVFF